MSKNTKNILVGLLINVIITLMTISLIIAVFTIIIPKQMNQANKYEFKTEYPKQPTIKGKVVASEQPSSTKDGSITIENNKSGDRKSFILKKTRDYLNNPVGNDAYFKYITDNNENNTFYYDLKQFGEPKNIKNFGKHVSN